jgi:hypothetical protein
MELVIAADGSVRFIHDDGLMPLARALGDVTLRRASHVEPTEDGRWTADMGPSGGPVLLAADGEPFQTRAEALAAERVWLVEQGVPYCAPCAEAGAR